MIKITLTMHYDSYSFSETELFLDMSSYATLIAVFEATIVVGCRMLKVSR